MMRRILTLTGLAVLAAGTWWAAELSEPQPQVVQRRVPHTPDYFSRVMTKTVMDENGKPKHRLVAVAMRHFPDDDTSELESPVLTVFRQDAPPWVIRSETGLVVPNKDEVFLGGAVYIDREGAKGVRPVNIVTSDLTVKPEIEYAETDNFAELVSGVDRVSGVGMQLHFGEPVKLTLLSKVRGKYATR